ncbi:DUF11 domain-containing protein [Spirosoma sp. BT704]|uniref:DUF11 domain-containing protein n=2 Tax=Spirosoma validum TaxID=2771355 RepID=A0A927B2R0_9BACT|nr:DUF11 domain-containing protein [Spirosoma validum]
MVTLLGAQPALAQIKITFPVSRQIVQRDNSNQATVQIAGSYGQALDVVEARVVARAVGQGTTSDWFTIQTRPTNGQFSGTMVVKGGWYNVEVRGRSGGVIVATDVLDRFGVGEVFAIMGHSNAQGSGCTINGENKCPTLEGPGDDRINIVTIDQNSASFNQYLSTPDGSNTADSRYLPGLAFSKLTTTSGMSPFAKMPWLWGPMGDRLVSRINVPILLYNAGFGGTNMQQTYWAAYNIPFEHSFVRYDLRMPYANVRNLMNLYVPTTGLRAVLVQHGANDRNNPTDSTKKYYIGVIDKMRTEFNKPNLGFIIALDSYLFGPNQETRSAQFQVINPGYKTFQGPDLDQISGVDVSTFELYRPDDTHFSQSGQRRAGQMWADAITDAYLGAITPYPAEMQPLTSLNCAGNNRLTITQPDGYQPIWSSGSTENSLTVGTGTYSARIKNPQNKVLFPPAVVVPDSVQPATPFISSNTGKFTICQSGGVRLTSSYAGINNWTTANNATSGIGRTIPATKTGVYTLQAKNPVYGCLSDVVSRNISLGATDVSLYIQPGRKVVALGDTVSYQLIVQNNSSCDAGRITLQNRLPANLTVESVGNNLSLVDADPSGMSKMINGVVDQIPAWQSVSYKYVARPTAAGKYINAAEVMTMTNPDVNATPGNGTASGEKDEARTELQTSTSSSNVFISPNPNDVPPKSNEADLSLIMTPSSRTATIGQIISFTLTVTNRGALTVNYVGLRNLLPAGLQFVNSASGMNPNQSLVSVGIGRISPGQSVSAEFTAKVISQVDLFNKAQIDFSGQPDFDSKPNNGYLNGEDDQASNELRWMENR